MSCLYWALIVVGIVSLAAVTFGLVGSASAADRRIRKARDL